MEVMSLSFVAPSRADIKPSPAARTAALPGVASQAVLSVSLPLRFVLLGLIALCTGTVLLVYRPSLLATYHYNQYIVAVTHLFTLGFITSIIMGAMYQLVPVALETKLHSERMAKWQFAFHLVGVTGMVWMFWKWDLKQVGHFGSLLALSVAMFVYNIGRTLRTVPRWSVVATALTSALAWLSVTVLVGLAIAASKSSYDLADQTSRGILMAPLIHLLKATAGFVARFDAIRAMHAHAHLGGIGFFVLLIVGISYRLVPMFTLSQVQNERRASASLWLLNLGLASAFPTILFQHSLTFIPVLVVLAGLGTFFVEIRAILAARQRRALDWGLRYFLTALTVLGLCGVLGLILCWPRLPLNVFTGQLENLYGFLALVGFVTFAILGMLYKIIPFLVWYTRYSREIGKKKVPALADLYSPALQAGGYWTFLGGLSATSCAILLSAERAMPWCCALLLLALCIFLANAGCMLSHLVRPRVTSPVEK
jgi:hypothetical protein